jgi:hypothetical protein
VVPWVSQAGQAFISTESELRLLGVVTPSRYAQKQLQHGILFTAAYTFYKPNRRY